MQIATKSRLLHFTLVDLLILGDTEENCWSSSQMLKCCVPSVFIEIVCVTPCSYLFLSNVHITHHENCYQTMLQCNQYLKVYV